MSKREIALWALIVALMLLLFHCGTAHADGPIVRGVAGEPLDATWSIWHNWRGWRWAHGPVNEWMADPGYIPTVWREEGPDLAEIVASDPLHQQTPRGMRYWQLFNEPDLEGGAPGEWAARYREIYSAIQTAARGPVLVGGINLYSSDEAWLDAFAEALGEDLSWVQWFGVHAYAKGWPDLTLYIEHARALFGPIPVLVTEAGWLWSNSRWETFRYMQDLEQWLDREGERLGIQAVLWFVPWDPCLEGYVGWNVLAPATVLYAPDGQLTSTGRVWAAPEGWADPWLFYTESLFVPLTGILQESTP